MTAMPPEPDVPVQPFGTPPARQRLVSRLPVWQIVVSLIKPALWTAAAVIILVGAVLELTIDNVPGAIVCLLVGGLSVWFAYRSCKRWVRRFLS